MPKGGGAIRGLDEKLAVIPATGAAGFSIPLPISPGRAGFSPTLALAYNSGNGNGPFGLGWSVDVPFIGRNTAKAVPRYVDGEDSDRLVVGGGEELVPERTNGALVEFERDGHRVRRYRPRVEADFMRIERWTAQASGETHWRTVSGNNVTSFYGRTIGSRIADPADPKKVFQWLLDEVRDDKGQIMAYVYKPERAQRYLEQVLYGNAVPFQPGGWLFELVFDYETERADPFSSYRSGFEIRTTRLCRKVSMFHRFPELGNTPTLVRSLNFSYQETPALTTLRSVQSTGHMGAETLSLPPVEFDYTERNVDGTVRDVDMVSAQNLPIGADGTTYRWTDLDGEGLSGILTEQATAWFYKRNQGGGQFGPLELVADKPNPMGPEAALMDLQGDGQLCLGQMDGPTPGFSRRTHDGQWENFRPFNFNLTPVGDEIRRRFLDLNGDGRPDVLIAGDEVLTWHASLGLEGFGAQATVRVEADEDKSPRVLLSDAAESIFTADMSGDGLPDLVRIRNGEVSYWPNLGYGRFGAKVSMTQAPVFDHPDQFDHRRIRLADIDGTGTADLLYIGRREIRFWFNQAGNSWSAAESIAGFPVPDNSQLVDVVDLLGNGTACVVWSSPLAGEVERPLRYVDLMGGVKPHLMNSVKNNLGAETTIHYAASTKFYLDDKKTGLNWVSKLPFPVYVVERTEVIDAVTGSRLVTSYAYHHGAYDGAEREFRGFARVDQKDAEEFLSADATEPLRVPPVLTKTWHHTGMYRHPDLIQSLAAEFYQGDAQAFSPPLPVLPTDLSTAGWVEANRALRGSVLRQEIFALDGTSQEPYPYSVLQHAYRVVQIQPEMNQAPGVYHAHAAESWSNNYERNPADPRVSHDLVLEVDEIGVPLRTVSIAYPRRTPSEFPEQCVARMTLSESVVRHVRDQAEWYRLAQPVETALYDVLPPALPPSACYQREALRSWAAGLTEIPYEEPLAVGTKRVLKKQRNLYLKNDLSGSLPLGQVESLALPYQELTLALTPGFVGQAYGARVTDTMLNTEARYIFQDGGWWAPSERIEFSAPQFYLPARFVDPFGNIAAVVYDGHALLPTRLESSQDPILNNVTTAVNDYRALAPALLTDANGNRSVIQTDALGRVTATAQMGKDGGSDGDTLADPTARFEYNLEGWDQSGKPIFVRALMRERHGAGNQRWRESFTYSDGFGRMVQIKVQAEPEEGSNVLRWVGTGRTVFNNKGQKVKQYEPFFSDTPEFENETELVQTGVTPVIHYDPLGRVVRTDVPDGTFSRTVFDSWRQESWDANDTVLESTWYADRGAPDPAQPAPADALQRAAWLTAKHADTPTVSHLDNLGRAFLSEANDGTPTVIRTRTDLDLVGNPFQVRDPLGRVAAARQFSLTAQVVHETAMDSGSRWTLWDAKNRPLYKWDSRGHRLHHTYDLLGRSLERRVQTDNGPEITAEFTLYGEHTANPEQNNLRGKIHRHFDAAGVVISETYDFKGNLIRGRRRLTRDPQSVPDWSANAANAEQLLESESFVSETEFDALDRVVRATTPEGSIIEPVFNEGNNLERLSARLRGAAAATPFILGTETNAKGKRTRINTANGLRLDYSYDPQSFRLSRVVTTRLADNAVLQDLSYVYDPAGNITEIQDAAQPTIYFNNAAVSATTRYEYDALYRLVRADGREHRGTSPSTPAGPDDGGRMNLVHPHDGQAMRLYQENYEYDAVGNLFRLVHAADQGNWTRRYNYASDNNRLLATSRPGDADGVFSDTYEYDAHGNMARMPHLAALSWNENDQLRAVNLGGGGTATYVYDAAGERVRKVIQDQNGRIHERIYLGTAEIYRERTGNTVTLQRESLHIEDEKRRVALVETNVADSVSVIRYQLGNHLGSASLEVSASGGIISYEEYYPFGSTSYQAGPSVAEVSLKRYRANGKERDNETGLYAMGARYYASWLGRWTSCDPIGLAAGINVYRYCRNNPVVLTDPNGTDDKDFQLELPPPDVGYKPKPPLVGGEPVKLKMKKIDPPKVKIPPPAAPAKPEKEAPVQQCGPAPEEIDTCEDPMMSPSEIESKMPDEPAPACEQPEPTSCDLPPPKWGSPEWIAWQMSFFITNKDRRSEATKKAPGQVGPMDDDPPSDARVRAILHDAFKRARETGGTEEEIRQKAFNIVQEWRNQKPIASQNLNYAAADHYIFAYQHAAGDTPFPGFVGAIGLIIATPIYDLAKMDPQLRRQLSTNPPAIPSEPSSHVRNWTYRGAKMRDIDWDDPIFKPNAFKILKRELWPF